jgi:hypothetical protein
VCRCCESAVDSDTLCLGCLVAISRLILREPRNIVARFWDVSEVFEANRNATRSVFAKTEFNPEALMGCAIGFVRTSHVDDGLCLAALCVCHTAEACWGCIAPGRVLTDPVALRFECIAELRAALGR